MDWQDSTEQEPPYQVVESETFTQQVQAILKDLPRWNEIKRVLALDLPRDTSIYPLVPGTDVLFVTLAIFPPITVYFTIDHNKRQIILLELHRV